jgi:hypothetical protein
MLHLRVIIPAAHKPLDGENRVVRIYDGLPLGDLAYQSFAAVVEGDDRWAQTSTLRRRYDSRLASLHH